MDVAPEVIAIGFAPEAARHSSGFPFPLVVIEACDRSWNQSVERVIALLKRHERPDRITLILPESLVALFSDSEVELELVPSRR